MRRGFVVAAVVGGLVGIIVVGVLVLLTLRTLAGGTPARQPSQGVLVALVLPDASGDVAVRMLAYYPEPSGRAKVVDPASRVVVPGTSASTLADAYTFGGGDALTRAYSVLSRTARPAWVVVEPRGWRRIAPAGLSLTLPRPVDVFNGTDLVSFPQGQVTLSPADVGILLGGIDALPASDRIAVMGSVASALQSALASSGGEAVASDLSPSGLSDWLNGLAFRSVPSTASP